MIPTGATTNRDMLAAKTAGIPWLQNKWGSRFLYIVGLALDSLQELTRQGMTAHMAGVGTPTALAPIGNDRVIVRGFAEADADFATRCQRAFDTWTTGGNAWSLLRNVLGYVTPQTPIVRTVGGGGSGTAVWDSMGDIAAPRDGKPTWRRQAANFNWDGLGPLWRFMLVIYPGAGLWTQGTTWGAAGLTWGTYGGSWGTSATPNQIASLRQIVSTWKNQKTWCEWIILSFDGSLFVPTSASTPDGTWGPWSKIVNGQRVAARSASASYCDGVA